MPRPPSFDPKRQNARVGVVQLPSEGRKGRAPAWPLAGKASPSERAAWNAMWKTPQAVAWERMGWTRTVGRYCRILVLAESGGNLAKDAWGEARQLEDRLGLTPKSMRLLLWVIVENELDNTAGKVQNPKASGARRLRAVDSTG